MNPWNTQQTPEMLRDCKNDPKVIAKQNMDACQSNIALARAQHAEDLRRKEHENFLKEQGIDVQHTQDVIDHINHLDKLKRKIQKIFAK